MLARLLYYGILRPLSLLPFPVLYRISDGLFYVLYYLVPYRKNVVLGNLRIAYPKKTEAQRRSIAKKFYRHLCDLLVESIKLFDLEVDEIRRRGRLRNPELMEKLAAEGRDVLLTAGHYNSWELGGLGFTGFIPHRTVILYAPLSSAFFEKKLKASRTKTGVLAFDKKQLRPRLQAGFDERIMVVFLTDQSPRRVDERTHWIDFLGRQTPVAFGAEKYAREFNLAVVHGRIYKTGRGFYESELELITDDPRATSPGDITREHTRRIEAQIEEEPAHWLWSHRRWKHEPPNDQTAADSGSA